MNNENENVKRYPVDFETLRKGDVVPAEDIEKYGGVSRESSEYALAALKLKGIIEKQLWQTNRKWTVVIHKDTIRILHDEEAAKYNSTAYNRGRIKMVKAHARNLAVDALMLPDSEKNKHQRELHKQAFELSAMYQARFGKRCNEDENQMQLPGAAGGTTQ